MYHSREAISEVSYVVQEKTETIVTSSTGLPGSLLRQAREEKGLTIDEMSAISISPSKRFAGSNLTIILTSRA